MVGVSVDAIYRKAKALGTPVTHAQYTRASDEAAERVYRKCEISRGADTLAEYLSRNGWTIALLSSSPDHWIRQVTNRLPWREKISVILSLNAHSELAPKPAPDGYRYLLRKLSSDASAGIALEDSNPGIAAARAAGLFTIGYREHLPRGYMQKETDAIAETMADVISIVSRVTIPS